MVEVGARKLRLVGESEGGPEDLVGEYLATLGGRSASTVEAYGRILRSLAGWVAERPGGSNGFRPELFTRTAVEAYPKELEGRGYSVSHRSRVKSVASGFAAWLIEEKGLLRKNPARGVEVPAQALLAPRRLSPDQRYVLKNLVERDGKVRSEAIFALGYWAGCRVSDVSWLTAENARIGPKVGWLRVGHKGGKTRYIDLLNEARRPLHGHLRAHGRDAESPYVFSSQRSQRLTEAGIHYWLRTLKRGATKDEWELVSDVTFRRRQRTRAKTRAKENKTEDRTRPPSGNPHDPKQGGPTAPDAPTTTPPDPAIEANNEAPTPCLQHGAPAQKRPLSPAERPNHPKTHSVEEKDAGCRSCICGENRLTYADCGAPVRRTRFDTSLDTPNQGRYQGGYPLIPPQTRS